MEEEKMLDVLYAIKRFLQKDEISYAKDYIDLQMNNLKGLTPENCKKTIYHFYPTYCKYCSNENCPDHPDAIQEHENDI